MGLNMDIWIAIHDRKDKLSSAAMRHPHDKLQVGLYSIHQGNLGADLGMGIWRGKDYLKALVSSGSAALLRLEKPRRLLV